MHIAEKLICQGLRYISGAILEVYFVLLLHAITYPFSKYFQVLYIFAQIFKYILSTFLCLFSEKSHPCHYFIGPVYL